MTVRHGATDTIDPGLAIRYLHGELSRDTRAELEAHLTECAACQTLVDDLAERSRTVQQALRTYDAGTPHEHESRALWDAVLAGDRARSRTARMRTAAGWVLALVGATALLSTPVRAWIADRWAGIRDIPLVAEPLPAETRDPVGVSFSPTGALVDVVFAESQAAGVLRVRFTGGDMAHLTTSSEQTDHLTVGPRGIEIANRPASEASYELTVPGGVADVRVRVGGGEVALVTRVDAGLVAEVSLGSRATQEGG